MIIVEVSSNPTLEVDRGERESTDEEIRSKIMLLLYSFYKHILSFVGGCILSSAFAPRSSAFDTTNTNTYSLLLWIIL